MIDFHNHILPKIDDGSDSVEISLRMLSEAENQGITDVVNTTHFMHPKMHQKKVEYDYIKSEINKLQLQLDKNDIAIKLHFGAETLYSTDIIKYKTNKLVTFNHGKYMLIEFLTNHIPDSHRQSIYELKMNEITPIIAHPERYKMVQKNISIISEWLESGCLIQIDGGSLIGMFGKKAQKTAEIIITNKWCQIIGSDAHNDTNRNFCLLESFNFAKNLIGNDALKLVNDNPKAVIMGEKINVDVNYENLYYKNIFQRFKNKLKSLS